MSRSKVLQRILDGIPQEEKILMKMQSDIIFRINEILRENNWTQKKLAEKLGKRPSEISKWLSGEHNFTIKSLAKLEAELGEDIISVPQYRSFNSNKDSDYSRKTTFTVTRNKASVRNSSKGYHFVGSAQHLSVTKKIA